MAIALGVEIDEIELLPFGGVARARGMDRVVGWREVLIALVGPLFNFLCAWCCLMAAKLWPQFAPALLTPVYLNLTMGCFNLLPAFPLDGGRILRSLLSSFLGRERATDVCAVIGVALGAGSVSYTHLDVYKRQPWRRSGLLASCRYKAKIIWRSSLWIRVRRSI